MNKLPWNKSAVSYERVRKRFAMFWAENLAMKIAYVRPSLTKTIQESNFQFRLERFTATDIFSRSGLSLAYPDRRSHIWEGNSITKLNFIKKQTEFICTPIRPRSCVIACNLIFIYLLTIFIYLFTWTF